MNAAAARRRSRRVFKSLRGFVPLLVLFGLWQLLGTEGSLTYPLPSESIAALEGLDLWSAIWLTLRTFILGLMLATVIGVAIGILVGAVPALNRAGQPVMDFFRALPAPVIVPVVALIIGPNLRAGIVILTLACVWPIMLNTAAGMRAVPIVRLEMARAMRMTQRERIRKVILPSLTPNVLTGLRVSVAIGLVATIFLEVLGVQRGVGHLLLESQQRFDAAAVWGLLFVAGVGGYLINVAVSGLDRYLLRHWPPRR